MPYNKLLETQVTDNAGRYSFRVGRSKYYLTVTKAGFVKTESDQIDLTAAEHPTVIASDIPLRRVGDAAPKILTSQTVPPQGQKPVQSPADKATAEDIRRPS